MSMQTSTSAQSATRQHPLLHQGFSQWHYTHSCAASDFQLVRQGQQVCLGTQAVAHSLYPGQWTECSAAVQAEQHAGSNQSQMTQWDADCTAGVIVCRGSRTDACSLQPVQLCRLGNMCWAWQ